MHLSPLPQNLAELPACVPALKAQLLALTDLTELELAKKALFGKKGCFPALAQTLAKLTDVEAKRQLGAVLNASRQDLQACCEQVQAQLQAQAWQAELLANRIDISLPGLAAGLNLGVGAGTVALAGTGALATSNYGSRHPVSLTRARIEAYFQRLGFIVADGPELEQDYFNFTALNIPEHHPARAMQDTFYLLNLPGYLLRTHTSNVQIRFMTENQPPIAIIAPGRVYRSDYDLTHTPMFHQVEGLLIAEQGVSFAGLKQLLRDFLSYFFQTKVITRFRPSFFPFTEPSAEVDMQCTACQGQGCRICSGTGWLEILGCGLVHPKVLANCGLDPDRYQGLAFGVGIDRLAMLWFGIPDLRLLFENDWRFLAQFHENS